MKISLLFAILASFHVSGDTIPFLDIGTNSYRNAEFLKVTPVEVMIGYDGGVFKMPTRDLPEPYKSQYWSEEKEKDYLTKQTQDKTKKESERKIADEKFRDAQKARVSKFIGSYKPIKEIDGQLYDFTRLLSLLLTGKYVPPFLRDYYVDGNIVQISNEGVLCNDKNHGLIFVKNYSHQDEKVDGDWIIVTGKKSGRYQYKTVLGATSTVPLFDCGATYNGGGDYDKVIRLMDFEAVLVSFDPKKPQNQVQEQIDKAYKP